MTDCNKSFGCTRGDGWDETPKGLTYLELGDTKRHDYHLEERSRGLQFWLAALIDKTSAVISLLVRCTEKTDIENMVQNLLPDKYKNINIRATMDRHGNIWFFPCWCCRRGILGGWELRVQWGCGKSRLQQSPFQTQRFNEIHRLSFNGKESAHLCNDSHINYTATDSLIPIPTISTPVS